MNAEKINKINKWLLVIFLAIQPILELIITWSKNGKFIIGGMSLGTVIRYFLLAIIVMLAILNNLKRKSTKIFIVTMIVYGGYTICQFINIRNFDIMLLGTSINKGIIANVMYISKYIIPVCVVYLVYILNFRYKELKIVTIVAIMTVSLIIIVTNLAGIDFVSYSFEDNTKVAANIIKWFDSSYEYTDWRMLTSRGLFSSGNELSAFFILLLPLTLCIALKEKKDIYFIVPFLQMLAMLLISTRISVYGSILVLIASILMYIVYMLFNKKIVKDKCIMIVVLVVLYGIFFTFSPFKNRIKVGDGGVNKYVNEEKKVPTLELSEFDNTEDRIFIKENFQKELIPYDMIDRVYSYLEHTDFWVHIIKDVNIEERNNSRKLKTFILSDIKENKNGRLDNWVGIGEMPIYPERDYVTQYYCLGIIGILIFLIPFMVVLIISGCNELIRLLKKKMDILQISFLISLMLIFVTAYLAGHALEPVFINSFIGLITGMMVSNLYKRNREKIDETGIEKYISKVYSNGKENFLKELENKVDTNEKTFIVTANPETLMIANENEEFDKCLCNKNVTIVPDGIGVIKGANLFNYDLKETITGVELSKYLFKLADEKSKSIYLFGAKKEVIEKMVDVLKKDYPNANIVGYEDGYVEDKQKVFEKIKELKPDIILVALGIPHQENLIYNNIENFDKGIFMGVGGSFDVLSGTKKRAPNFFVKTHLEWLYRITVEPKRLKRFFKSNIKYIFKIIQER